ncbi:MAG: hypothetical protein RJA17_1486 [Pseudomonadota bacterium]|jgi:hypothetical protein
MPSAFSVLIVCHVVDHYGDAGVCLRLAKGLAARQCRVQLVIDQPALIAKMSPSLPANVRVTEGLTALEARAMPDLLIEAFQHDAPFEFRMDLERAASLGARPRRVLLDYLATEPWADATQNLLAPDHAINRALNTKGGPRLGGSGPAAHRVWMAPSFGQGLVMGEPGQLERMLEGAEDGAGSVASMRGDGVGSVSSPWPLRVGQTGAGASTFRILGFGYDDAPWGALEAAIAAHGLPSGFADFYIHRPTGLDCSQDEFDMQLCTADFNFVRGEDSFVRAHWAAASARAVPFVWQPYRQADAAHRDKLVGWINQVLPGDALAPLRDFHLAFNGLAGGASLEVEDVGTAWQRLLQGWGEMRRALQASCQRLAQRLSLEDRLIQLLERR